MLLLCVYAGGRASLRGREAVGHPTLERREQRLRPEQQAAVLERSRRHAAVDRLDEDRVLAADLVVEMTKIKHPMDAGQKGQRGIEW